MTATIELPATAPRVTDETLRTLFALPAEERQRVGMLLLDSLDSPPADPAEYRQAAKDELESRIRELEAGRMECYTMEEAIAILHNDSDEELA